MNTNAPDDLTFTQAAAAVAMTPAGFSTLVRSKGFAGRKSPRHRHAKLISRTELEALIGYKLTDAQIAAASSAKANVNMGSRLNLDFGWIKFGYELANNNWLKHMTALGLDHVAPPQCDPELNLKFAERDIFTRSEVYELLESCVRQRDAQWWDWVNDSVQRAQFPSGPTTLDFKYPEPVEE